ncbi:Holliday junction recognition protein [Octodon degus]|uniref:Holliday junction recognition protein n=1 Tax=Octodon degus TaxID=10160 RepID=A0A6P6EZP6_OCTDE|nr:Holliday junction recognition protein [Octodon degus]
MEVQALASQGREDDELLLKLRDNRCRFQKRMQQLIAKFEHPFEDDPLVHMSTLTYMSPEGLRVWGGKLVRETNGGQIQDTPEKQGDELLHPCAQAQDTDSESSDTDAVSDQGSPSACALPAVPQSPVKDELRRKYLTQVDILLQDAGYFEAIAKGVRKDTPETLGPSSALPVLPQPGSSGGDSAERLRSPRQPASSPPARGPLHPYPEDMAIVPRSDSLSFLETSNQSFEATDICSVTISDLYEGMLHSMSRLLSTRPSSTISTKTLIMQSWSSRRRHPRRGRVQTSEACCKGARHSQGCAKARSPPCLELQRKRRTLRDCKNLLQVTRHKTDLKLKRTFKENSPQLPQVEPSPKELQVRTPWTPSSLSSLDFSSMHLDWENRLTALGWLISPRKVVPRPHALQDHAGNRYREIESKFDRFYLECCLSPRRHPQAAGHSDSLALDVYRGGGVRPGAPWGSGAHRLRFPFNRAKAKSLSEIFEYLDKRSAEVSRCPPRRDSKSHPPQSPGSSMQTSDLFQGHNSETIRKAVSPSHAISVPRTEAPSSPKSRYDEIKERFDQLHQKYIPVSPQPAKLPSLVRVCADKARAGVQGHTGNSIRRSHLDPCLQGLLRSPQDPTTFEAHVFAGTAQRDPPVPVKRRRMLEPQVYRLQTRQLPSPCQHNQGKKNTSFRMEEKSDFG